MEVLGRGSSSLFIIGPQCLPLSRGSNRSDSSFPMPLSRCLSCSVSSDTIRREARRHGREEMGLWPASYAFVVALLYSKWYQTYPSCLASTLKVAGIQQWPPARKPCGGSGGKLGSHNVFGRDCHVVRHVVPGRSGFAAEVVSHPREQW